MPGRNTVSRKRPPIATSVLLDASLNTVVVATRHDSHARYVCEALRARKHIFVEKPLAITRGELDDIEKTFSEVNATEHRPSSPGTERMALFLMVGFNRRFAPQMQKIKALLAGVQEPKSFMMTVNAGAIPAEHWTQILRSVAGVSLERGAILSICLRFLAGDPIASIQTSSLGIQRRGRRADSVSIYSLLWRWIGGHSAVPGQRAQIISQGTTGSVLRRSHPPAR